MAQCGLRNYANTASEHPFGALPKRADSSTVGIKLTIIVFDPRANKTLLNRKISIDDDTYGLADCIRVIAHKEHKTYAFTHGFTGSVEFGEVNDPNDHMGFIPKTIENIKTIERQRPTSEFVTFLAFDWRKGAAGAREVERTSGKTGWTYYWLGYDQAASNTRTVGVEIAKFLHNLSDVLQPSTVHLVGFSLGAHVMGFAGKQYQYLSGGSKFARITGLDPAGPLFRSMPAEGRLSKEDAHFVDVIHTNAGIFGITVPCGHADFWVAESPKDGRLYYNKHRYGSAQPGCFDSNYTTTAQLAMSAIGRLEMGVGSTVIEGWSTNISKVDTFAMSHFRAHVYYRHSIGKPQLFLGQNVKDGSTATMGFHCAPSTRGSYNVPLENKGEMKRYFEVSNSV